MKACRFLKKGDRFLLLAVAVAAVLFVALYLLLHPSSATAVGEVAVNGTVIGRYSLSETRTVTVPDADGGYNTLIFENGTVRVQDADCPDRLCVKQGRISRLGEAIVCLPHGLVITVRQGETGEVDFISR